MQSREIHQPIQPRVRKQNRLHTFRPFHSTQPQSPFLFPHLTVGVAGVDGGRFRPSLNPIPRAKEGRRRLPPPTIMVVAGLARRPPLSRPLFSGRPLATREAVGEVDRNGGWRDY